MNKIQKINTLLKRLKADGCQILSTYHDPQTHKISIRLKTYDGQVTETTYDLNNLKGELV